MLIYRSTKRLAQLCCSAGRTAARREKRAGRGERDAGPHGRAFKMHFRKMHFRKMHFRKIVPSERGGTTIRFQPDEICLLEQFAK